MTLQEQLDICIQSALQAKKDNHEYLLLVSMQEADRLRKEIKEKNDEKVL